MESIFDAASREALFARIAALRPDTSRRWGAMTPAQALAHVVPTFEVALGERTMTRIFIGRLIGRLALRKVAFGDKPWKPGLPTDPSMVVRDGRDLERERARATAVMTRFGEGGPPALARAGAHPFFGRLAPAEWDRLMWRHVDHHLRQFGV